jgi:hypothetical protein
MAGAGRDALGEPIVCLVGNVEALHNAPSQLGHERNVRGHSLPAANSGWQASRRRQKSSSSRGEFRRDSPQLADQVDLEADRMAGPPILRQSPAIGETNTTSPPRSVDGSIPSLFCGGVQNVVIVFLLTCSDAQLLLPISSLPLAASDRTSEGHGPTRLAK